MAGSSPAMTHYEIGSICSGATLAAAAADCAPPHPNPLPRWGRGSFGGRGLLRGGGEGAGCGGRAVGLEEGADVAQRDRDLLRVGLPRIEAHLRVGREVRALDRDRIGVRRDVVG